MVRFLQQTELGWGNYTEERQQWLGNPDVDEAAQQIQKTNPPSPDNLRMKKVKGMEE